MRRFTVTLTNNNLSGPFDIYYVNSDDSVVLSNLESGSPAVNITASQLSSGVSILISFDATKISVLNKKETCFNSKTLNVPYVYYPPLPPL